MVLAYNVTRVPNFLTVSNQVNLFQLGIEKAIVVLIMTFVIISGEIDLSVASMMGLSAAVTPPCRIGVPMPLAILVALSVGAAFGLLNGYFVAVVGLSSLAVTWQATSGSGVWRDCSCRTVPSAGSRLVHQPGQHGLVGPLTLSILIFAALAIVATVVLHFSGFGRLTYVIGNSAQVARFSVSVARTKIIIFMMSGLISALAGVLMAAVSARCGPAPRRVSSRHHHRGPARRGQHFRWRRLDDRRASLHLPRAQSAKRSDHRRRHRQHPDWDHRPAADPVRARSQSGGAVRERLRRQVDPSVRAPPDRWRSRHARRPRPVSSHAHPRADHAMMTAGKSSQTKEEVNVNVMTRRLLSGVMCAGLLIATMGAATLETPVAGSRSRERQPPRSQGRTSR